jgi:putative membrane-bound dehydrogenase-like protein
LWVCEMKGYSEHREDQISNLVRLSDRDSDGLFDERQVILEGLKWPTAVFPWAQGVLLVDSPDILFVQDLDADGVFEIRRVLLTGLSFSNVQGLANSFRWGLDNRIHLSTSSNGGRVYRPEDGPVAAFDIRGRDLAWDPRTDEWSTTAGGGQHGMAFDDWGRKWVCSNSDHLQQIIFDAYGEIPSLSFNTAPRRVSAAADGPQAEVFRVSRVEPWRILRTRLRVDGLAKGPIEGGGRAAGYFTGATGVNVYRGDAYPETWRDRSGDSSLVVVGDVGGNLIHRKRVTREGILHVGRRIDEGREWVASNDLWFRPAQFENGPDGTLHVIDVYREVIEHPLSLPPQIKPYLDLNAGRDRGRLYRIVPDGFVQPAHRDLGQLDDMGLVELLEHPNAWHRETAARLIYQRQPSSVQVTRRLEELAKSSESPLGRLHALLTLDGLGRRPADVLARTLQDEHPQVRRWAVRLVGDDWPLNLETEAAWLACADDPSPEVQFEWVWSVARRTRDSESGQTPEDRLSAGALESCLQKVFDRIQPSSVDRWMRSAAQATIQERLALFLQVNLSRPDRTDLSIWPMQWLGEVVQSVSRTGGREAIELLGTELPRQVPRPEGAWMAVAASLQQNGGDTATDGLGGNAGPAALEDWIAKVKANVLSEAHERVDRARVAIEGDVAPRETWDAVERLKWCTADEAVPALLAWIEPSEPMDVQLAALRALAAFDDARVYDRYVDLWEGFGPRSRAMVEEQWFAREKGIARFMAATQAGEISRANLPWSRLEWLSRSNDTQHQPQALELLAWRQRQGQAVDHAHYRSQIPATGDAEVGRQVFERHCAACHQPVGDHSPLAPSLTGVAEKGADYALTHVLQPNLEVHSQYLNYILELSDGRIATGMIVEESAGGLMLARGDGTREAILRSEILAMKSTGQSLMPEGLERSINPVEMGHLLHFLVTGQ